MFVDEIKVATNKSVSAQIERKYDRAPYTRNIIGNLHNLLVGNLNLDRNVLSIFC